MWNRGAIQYPELMEPVLVPIAPPSVPDLTETYGNTFVNKRRIPPTFTNVFPLDQVIVPYITLDNYVEQFGRRKQVKTDTVNITEVTVPPSVVYLDWLYNIQYIPKRRKPVYLYDKFERAGNYIPVIPLVPTLSWDPTFQDIIWTRRLPIAAIPNTDFRDTGYFIDTTPFDPNARLVAIVDISETWSNHFSSRSWTNIQDQINAGYPLYCQPTLTSGYYEEIVDFGFLYENTVIGLTFNTEAVSGVVNCQPKLSYSVDGISYTSYVNGTQLFATAVRFVKFMLDFSASGDTNVAYYRNIQVNLSVRRETDQGRVDCLASDSGGTLVLFNKPFRDVESITATPQTTSAYYTVIDFVDVPNPTSFRILVFNISGTRVNATVDWIARGIT